MLAEYIKAISLLSIDSKQRLIKENHDLKSAQAEKIATLEEEIERNRKKTEYVESMIEALKGAVSSKSEAAKIRF